MTKERIDTLKQALDTSPLGFTGEIKPPERMKYIYICTSSLDFTGEIKLPEKMAQEE